MIISLKEVTRENWTEAVELKVWPEQAHFVPTVLRSIAKAYIRPEGPPVTPYAIYADTQMVGFFTFTCNPESTTEYWINGFLIDKAYQKRGYGRAALTEMLKLFRQLYPQATQVNLTVESENHLAQNLYQSFGFNATGQVHDDELVYSLNF